MGAPCRELLKSSGNDRYSNRASTLRLTNNSCPLPLVGTVSVRFGEDAACHGLQQLLLGCSTSKREHRIESIDLEEVPMLSARGRGSGSTITKVVLGPGSSSLQGTRDLGGLWHALDAVGQHRAVGRDIEDYPVDPRFRRRVLRTRSVWIVES